MRRSLLARLEPRLKRLEVRATLSPIKLVLGSLRQLPSEYKGEKHVAITKQLPTDEQGREHYEFEERPGPGPLLFGENTMVVHFIEARREGPGKDVGNR